MRLVLALLLVAACGGKKREQQAREPARGDAIAQAPADAAIDAVVAVDVAQLPVWPTVEAPGDGPPVEVHAADAPARRLLVALATDNLLVRSDDRRVTGRISAPSRAAAFATLAKQLGVAVKPVAFSGQGTKLDLQLAATPAEELLQVLGTAGNVNIVAPGALPRIDIVARQAPWDGVLAELAVLAGRKIHIQDNVYYLLPKNQALPPAPPFTGERVTINAHDATIGQVTATLQHLTGFAVGGCNSGRFSIHLRDVKPAEAARALALVAKVKLPPGVKCPTMAFDPMPPLSALRVRVIASKGDEAAAALEANGATEVIGRKEPGVKQIGPDVVTFDHGELRLVPSRQQPGGAADLRRASARIAIGSDVQSFVETDQGTRVIDGPAPVPLRRGDVN
ncbi:MAG TPA: hypothetical protein VIV11_32965 [Kofleriaceae bacterium]